MLTELHAQSAIEMDTKRTANKRLFTAENMRRKIPGPTRPMIVIKRRTESTVHFFEINSSAKWPETV